MFLFLKLGCYGNIDGSGLLLLDGFHFGNFVLSSSLSSGQFSLALSLVCLPFHVISRMFVISSQRSLILKVFMHTPHSWEYRVFNGAAPFYTFSTNWTWTTDTSRRRTCIEKSSLFYLQCSSITFFTFARISDTFKFDNTVSQVWCLMLANNNSSVITWIDIWIDTRTHAHNIRLKRKVI